MSESWWARLGYRLERFGWLHPVLFRQSAARLDDDGGQVEYVNRMNGHTVVREVRR